MPATWTRIFQILTYIIVRLFVFSSAIWGCFALFYSFPGSEFVRGLVAILFSIASLTTFYFLSFRPCSWRRAIVFYIILFATLTIWWIGIKPSNDRDWQSNVALLPWATVENKTVTFHNIRNFNYRDEDDYTINYYDKSFDLDKLQGVDLLTSYWMGPNLAHVFLSFNFADDNHLTISIETRKEKTENYDSLKGFFKQYELYYVVADERDAIRLRTNFRKNPPEEVFLFPMKGNHEDAQRLFLQYIKKINHLKTEPEFYNSFSKNCSTNIWMNSLSIQKQLPLSWKILLSGHVPEYLFENKRLKTDGLTFPELQLRSKINSRAQASSIQKFSNSIREIKVISK